MKGLFIKEFFCNKLFVILATIGFIASIGALATGNITRNISSVCVAIYLFSLLISVSVKLDESGKWNQFAMTMPLKKSSIIMSRYLLIGAMMALGVIIIIPITIIIGDSFTNIIYSLGINIAFILLIIDIIIPVTIKFGQNIASIIIIIVLFFQMFFLFGNGKEKIFNLAIFNSFSFILITFIISLIGILISYKMSLVCYRKKNF